MLIIESINDAKTEKIHNRLISNQLPPTTQVFTRRIPATPGVASVAALRHKLKAKG